MHDSHVSHFHFLLLSLSPIMIIPKEDHSFCVQFVIIISGETTHRRCLVFNLFPSFSFHGIVLHFVNYAHNLNAMHISFKGGVTEVII